MLTLYVMYDTKGEILLLTKQLRRIFVERGITWQECAELCDIPLETVRNLYYGKVKDPRVSTMLSLSNALHISVNCLMGETLFSEEEDLLVTNYRQCGSHGKHLLQQIAKIEADTAKLERESSNKYRIPCILPDSFCKDGSKYSISERNYIYTSEADAFIAIQVPNNNWTPKFHKGDLLLLNNKFPCHKETALFSYHTRIYFRKYLEKNQNYLLRCVNGQHSDLILKKADLKSLFCIGTLIDVVRN